MIASFHSGKFWLKLMVFGLTSWITLYILSAVGLHYLFNSDKIYRYAEMMMAGTGYRIDFSDNISRSLFPRPTVTLHQVRLSQNQHHYNELTADNMKIGLSWQILFGRTVIEKWQLTGANANIFRDSDNHWNFDNLWQSLQQRPHKHKWHINRLTIENATIRIRDGQKNQIFQHLDAQIKNLSGNDRQIRAEGIWQHPLSPVTWQFKAINYQGDQWRQAQLNIQTMHPFLGATAAQLNFDGRWLNDKQLLQTNDVKWNMQSQYNDIHADGTGKNWQLGWSSLTLPQLNALIIANTANHDTANVSLTAIDTHRQDDQWSIKQFQIDGGWQNQKYQSSLSIGGQLIWPQAQSWHLANLTITSHQDNLNGLPNQRFILDLTGDLSGHTGQNSTLKLQGQFDNQPLNIAMVAQTEPKKTIVSGNINLTQLNLRPYTQDISARSLTAWLRDSFRWLNKHAVDWQINIDHIITNSLQLNQLRTHLSADQNSIRLSPINVQMYDGASYGFLNIKNNPALSWQLQQNFHNIQIKPFLQDNFNFHNLDGKGDALIAMNGQNHDAQHWLTALNGNIDIQLQQGLLTGIDINNILQNKNNRTTMSYNETSHTPFKLFKLHIPLRNGLSQKSVIALSADNFDIKGQGGLNLSSQLIDYMILISTRHYGEQSLLPLKINGAITHPNFSIDYQRLTAGLHTPEQKQESLRQTLKQQWSWLNQGASNEINDWAKQP